MPARDSSTKVYVISGAAASGKTTYAKKLQKKLHFEILDLDDNLGGIISREQKHIDEVGMEKFLAEIRDSRYDDLQLRGIEIIKKGKSVALVAPFSRHIHDLELWQHFCSPFIALGVELELHWLNVDRSERAKRIALRKASRDSEKNASPEQMRDFLRNVDDSPPIHRHIYVNGAEA